MRGSISPRLQNSEYPPVILCAIQTIKNHYQFPKKQDEQIKKIINTKSTLQIILKFIHNKYNDEGLRYTLIHKIYECSNEEIQFYVPQLVYLVIKKNCKPLKKLLIYKASNNEALRRLILWNVKAFTVLIKQKDLRIRRIIQEFEQNLISTVKSKSKFTHSEKAIAMITTASLILKKMQPLNLKQKLQRFIKRYNSEYLSNLNHAIIIPFRKSDQDNITSNYIVRIVQDDCSCFPTKKRVPYRIIFQTIDPLQIGKYQPSQQYLNPKKIQADKERDLFDQVSKTLQETFGHSKFKSLLPTSDNRYPFVVDVEESLNINQLTKFAKKIQKEEKEIEKENQTNFKSKIKNTLLMRKNTVYSRDSADNLHKSFARLRGGEFQIKNDPNLQKFQAIYIPTIPSGMRKSACHMVSMENLFPGDKSQQKIRWSSDGDSSFIKKQQDNIKVIQQQTKWNPAYQESAWGEPWVVKQKRIRQSSYFKNFPSLKLHNVVVKGGDDLRQQIVCMQLIFKMKQIIKKAKVDIFIKPYEIIVLSENSGILQFVTNSKSIDAVKKQRQGISIGDFFSQVFQTQKKLQLAKQNFIQSLVGSSIMTYVLTLKDRHNGNILLDNQGHIIHIDFGFILGMSPGGLNFQSSPFKLTLEYVDVMGGKNSPDYKFFQERFCQGMRVLRQKIDQLCLVLQIMMQQSDLQCFQNFKIAAFRQKFKLNLSEQKFQQHCLALIQKSYMNSRTALYDYFQYNTNGIMA